MSTASSPASSLTRLSTTGDEDDVFFDAVDSLNVSVTSTAATEGPVDAAVPLAAPVAVPGRAAIETTAPEAAAAAPEARTGGATESGPTVPTQTARAESATEEQAPALMVRNLDTGELVSIHALETPTPVPSAPAEPAVEPTKSTGLDSNELLVRNLDTGEFLPVNKVEKAYNPITHRLSQRTDLATSNTDMSSAGKGGSDSEDEGAGPTTGKSNSGKKAWFKTVFGSGKSTPVEEEDAASTGDGGPHNFIKVSAHHKDRKDFDRLVHVQDLEGHQGHVWVVRFSTDGRYLVSGGSDAIVRLWALVTEPKDQPSSPSPSVEAQPQKRRSTEFNAVPIFNSQPLRLYRGHEADVLDLSWSKTNFILSSSLDKTVRLWHATRQECLCVFQHTDVVASAVFSPKDDRHFLSGALDGKLRLWSVPEKRVVHYNELPDRAPITAVAFSNQGDTAIAGTYSGICIIYNTEGLKYNTQIYVKSSRGRNKGKKITGIETTPHEDKILISSNDSRMRAYHLNDKSLFCKYRGYVNASSQIRGTYSEDGKYIISGSEDHRVYIWQATSAVQPNDVGFFSSFRRDLNESFETFEPTSHQATVTTTAFAPSKLRARLEEHGVRTTLPPPSPAAGGAAKSAGYGMFIVVGNSQGVIRLFENEQPPAVAASGASIASSISVSSIKAAKSSSSIAPTPANPFARYPLLGTSEKGQDQQKCLRCGGTQLKLFDHNKEQYAACLSCSISWKLDV